MFQETAQPACPECKTAIAGEVTRHVAPGSAWLCPQCGTPVIIKRKKPAQSLSKPLQVYLAYCQEHHHTRSLPFGFLRVRRFKNYLAARRLALDALRERHVEEFLRWIETTDGPESVPGYASNLRDFFMALTDKGVLSVNPMARMTVARSGVAPLSSPNLSEELRLFIDHQGKHGHTDTLSFDV
ncbi:MAG: hypothetical protein HQM02_04985, partial [Magnetococcales bacterium]|nr:hypothetical protein [Magnetococcales bacterium]